eukprot:SAG31_NODE_27961_length_417_cov_1.333333_1_plen_120_part_10
MMLIACGGTAGWWTPERPRQPTKRQLEQQQRQLRQLQQLHFDDDAPSSSSSSSSRPGPAAPRRLCIATATTAVMSVVKAPGRCLGFTARMARDFSAAFREPGKGLLSRFCATIREIRDFT